MMADMDLVVAASIVAFVGGLAGSLMSGWAWGLWGAATTYSMSSAFALLGLVCVALGVRKADLDDGGDSRVALSPRATPGGK